MDTRSPAKLFGDIPTGGRAVDSGEGWLPSVGKGVGGANRGRLS